MHKKYIGYYTGRNYGVKGKLCLSFFESSNKFILRIMKSYFLFKGQNFWIWLSRWLVGFWFLYRHISLSVNKGISDCPRSFVVVYYNYIVSYTYENKAFIK